MKFSIQVPATTANVGSGFDTMGIALSWYDELHFTTDTAAGLHFEITGEGADSVPRDASHLVVASMCQGFEQWGGQLPSSLKISAHNTIPHARGLGSSAAAIAAGLAAAWVISHEAVELDREEVCRLACVIEGHADNAAAAVLGGATLGWLREDGSVRMVELPVDQSLVPVVWVPENEVPTAGARAVLPEAVSRPDAVQQAANAAVLPTAIWSRPDLLLEATADRLHQHFRSELMPESWQLLQRLRQARIPATISGAGPTVFALCTPETLPEIGDEPGFSVHRLEFGQPLLLRA